MQKTKYNHRRQLLSYSIYGEKNPASDVLTPSELKKIKQEELTELIKSLPSYSHRILYYVIRIENH